MKSKTPKNNSKLDKELDLMITSNQETIAISVILVVLLVLIFTTVVIL